ncbi:MAG: YybS family protein [Bacillota bacterium]|nr:YybS family protein [Bacillota bacterium]
MPRSMTTRTLVESALLVAIATVFCVLDAYVPVFALVYPLPIVVLVVRRGVKVGAWATVVTIAATSAVVGPLQGLTVFAKVGIIGITLAWCIRKRFPPLRTLVVSSVAVAVSMVFIFGLGAWLGGFSLAKLEETLRESMNSATAFYRSLGMPEARLEQAEAEMAALIETAKVILPASLFMAVVGVAGVNYLLARLVLGKLGYKMEEMPPFARWRVSWPFGWGYIAGLVLSVVGQAKGIQILWKAGANVMSLFGAVFLVQGIALCWFFMDRYRLNVAVRVLLGVFALLNPTVLQIVSWVGLFDAWFDFRKLAMESGGKGT